MPPPTLAELGPNLAELAKAKPHRIGTRFGRLLAGQVWPKMAVFVAVFVAGPILAEVGRFRTKLAVVCRCCPKSWGRLDSGPMLPEVGRLRTKLAVLPILPQICGQDGPTSAEIDRSGPDFGRIWHKFGKKWAAIGLHFKNWPSSRSSTLPEEQRRREDDDSTMTRQVVDAQLERPRQLVCDLSKNRRCLVA